MIYFLALVFSGFYVMREPLGIYFSSPKVFNIIALIAFGGIVWIGVLLFEESLLYFTCAIGYTVYFLYDIWTWSWGNFKK